MKSICHNSSIKHYYNGYYCTTCFKEQFKSKKVSVLYTGLLIALMAVINPVKAPSTNSSIGAYSVYSAVVNDIIPTDSSVLKELVKNKCVLVSVAVAQARIESANYTSDIALHNKNLFGIKVHKCNYVKGERKGHATFDSYKDNIACYCHIQHRYLNKIDNSYAQDSSYCQKVKQMK